MKLLFDGVAFQPGPEAAMPETRRTFWSALLGALASSDGLGVVLLDRGGAPAVDGVEAIPFPARGERYAAADSELLQQVAVHVGADAFLSTGWTTPLRLPSLILLDPDELAGGGEAELAIAYARETVSISSMAPLDMAALVEDMRERLEAMVARYRSGADDAFFDAWSKLRLLQVAVEV